MEPGSLGKGLDYKLHEGRGPICLIYTLPCAGAEPGIHWGLNNNVWNVQDDWDSPADKARALMDIIIVVSI